MFWVISAPVSRKRWIVVVLWRIRASSGMPWVLWGRRPASPYHNTASVSPRWSRRTGRLRACDCSIPQCSLAQQSSFGWRRKAKTKSSRSPVRLPLQFGIASLPVTPTKWSLVEHANFVSVMTIQSSREKSRRSGRDRRAACGFRGVLP